MAWKTLGEEEGNSLTRRTLRERKPKKRKIWFCAAMTQNASIWMFWKAILRATLDYLPQKITTKENWNWCIKCFISNDWVPHENCFSPEQEGDELILNISPLAFKTSHCPLKRLTSFAKMDWVTKMIKLQISILTMKCLSIIQNKFRTNQTLIDQFLMDQGEEREREIERGELGFRKYRTVGHVCYSC